MSPTISVRNTVWRDASQSVLYPNEPVGYSPIFEYNFTAPILHGVDNSNGTEITGCVWKWDPSGNQLAVIDVSDAGQQSPTKVARYRYSAGHPPGVADGLFAAWICPSSSSGMSAANRYQEMYESAWFNLWGAGDGTYENQSVGTKLWGFWGVGNAAGTFADIFLNLNGLGGGTYIASSFTFKFTQQNHITRNLNQNVNTSFRIIPGVWYQYELLTKLNFPVSASNGILKLWLNGTLVLDYSDVQFRNAGAPAGFNGRSMSATWGGSGGSNKSRIDDVYWDHMYISGIQGE